VREGRGRLGHGEKVECVSVVEAWWQEGELTELIVAKHKRSEREHRREGQFSFV
jgi:hypothetical protein